VPAEPLIVTAALDPAAQAYFDRLRTEHFPPDRNFLAAHVTLFHALPGEYVVRIRARLERAVSRPGPDVEVCEVCFLGRGVAYGLRSADLEAVRAELAADWRSWLSPQDAQRWRPHITVQNKVAPAQARALQAELAEGFQPLSVKAAGLLLWRYEGGPWSPVSSHPFGADGKRPVPPLVAESTGR
jgi:2'-5' RNA ligase